MPVDERPQVLDASRPALGSSAPRAGRTCAVDALLVEVERRGGERSLSPGRTRRERDSARNRCGQRREPKRAVADACLVGDDAEAIRLLNRVGRRRGVEACWRVVLPLRFAWNSYRASPARRRAGRRRWRPCGRCGRGAARGCAVRGWCCHGSVHLLRGLGVGGASHAAPVLIGGQPYRRCQVGLHDSIFLSRIADSSASISAAQSSRFSPATSTFRR